MEFWAKKPFDDHESRAAAEMNILNRKTMGEEWKYWLDNFEGATQHSTLMGNDR